MTRTALYRYFDAEGVLLYCGITSDAEKRDAQHKTSAAWIGEAARVTYQWLESREHAAALEAVAIRFEKPKHNIAEQAKAEPVDDAARGMALAVYLKSAGIRQADFADAIGVTQGALSKMCASEGRISIETATRIERHTNGAVPVSRWGKFAHLATRGAA
jgi:predicted GIY-YIG superfamily endonuclease